VHDVDGCGQAGLHAALDVLVAAAGGNVPFALVAVDARRIVPVLGHRGHDLFVLGQRAVLALAGIGLAQQGIRWL
jgi:hypothetical protein